MRTGGRPRVADRLGVRRLLPCPRLRTASSDHAGRRYAACPSTHCGHAECDQAPRPARIGARTARAVVCDNRALVYARDEHVGDALDGLVRFVVLERQVTFQEDAMRRLWPAMDADYELTHALAPGYNQRQAAVNEMTELAGRAKASNLRTGIALAQMNPALTDPSKRFFGEFAVVSGMHERYDSLIDPLTYAVETYERANTRMIETRNAAKERTHFLFEFILMAVIVVLIAWELLQMMNE